MPVLAVGMTDLKTMPNSKAEGLVLIEHYIRPPIDSKNKKRP